MIYFLTLGAILVIGGVFTFIIAGERFFVWLGGAILAIVATVFFSVHQIEAGHVGLVYQFGDIIDQRGSGLQYTMPWQAVEPASIKIQSRPYTGKNRLDSFSKKTQDVYVDAIVNFYVAPKDIQPLYRNVGHNYAEILIDPRVAQVFKDETVKYETVDIAPNRETIRHVATERLKRELQKDSIIVTDVLIKNISFNPEFQKSIEDVQIANQQALAELEKVRASQYKAQQQVEKAKGEAEALWVLAVKQAEANKKLAESITPNLIQYQAIQKLSPNVKVLLLPSGTSMIMPQELLRGTSK